jgi:hypothetical protein
MKRIVGAVLLGLLVGPACAGNAPERHQRESEAQREIEEAKQETHEELQEANEEVEEGLEKARRGWRDIFN